MSQGTCLRTGEPATCGCPCSACSEWVAECGTFHVMGREYGKPRMVAKLTGGAYDPARRRIGVLGFGLIAAMLSVGTIK